MYNWSPASIFMGDSGSLFLGFLLVAISLQIANASVTAWGMLAPCVVLGGPLLDTVSSMIRRLLDNRSPFASDLDHIHHRMVRAAGSVRSGVLVPYAVGLLFGCLGVAVSLAPWPWPRIAVGLALMLSFLMLRRLSYIWINVNLPSISRQWRDRQRTTGRRRRIVVAPAELPPSDAETPDAESARTSLAVVADLAEKE